MRLTSAGLAEKFVILCLGIFLFLLFFCNAIETEDVWEHLSSGRWIVHHQQVPHEDIFPFANERTKWLNYDWLGNVLLFLMFKMGGYLGLKFFRALLFMSVVGVFFVYFYRRLPISFLVILSLTMSYGMLQRLFLRPELFSLLFIQMFLIVLFSYEASGGFWKLLLLPVAGIFWYNIHAGALVYGGPIIFVFLLSVFLKNINYIYGQHYPPDAVISPAKQVKELALILLVYLAAFVINPYGLEGLLFPYKIFLFPQFLGYYKKGGVIGEHLPPGYIFASLRYFYYFLLMGCSVVLLALNKKNNFTLTILFIIALFAFFLATRNSSFFAVTAAYVIARAAQNIGFMEMWARVRWSVMANMVMLAGLALFLVIQAFNVFNESIFLDGKRVSILSLATNPYVTSSIKLLKDNGITGPVFNSSLLGGAIVWFDYPQLRPFNDGRNGDMERFNNGIAIFENPEKVWPLAERDYGFKTVIVNMYNGSEQKFVQYLNVQTNWQLIAVHGPIVVYVKRGVFHLPEILDRFEQRLKSIALTSVDINQLKLLSQRKQRTVLDNFINPSPFEVDMFSDGETFMSLGYKGAGVKNFIGALKVSDQSYMHETVGVLLDQLALK